MTIPSKQTYAIYMRVIALFITCPEVKLKAKDMALYLNTISAGNEEGPEFSDLKNTDVRDGLLIAHGQGYIGLEGSDENPVMVSGPLIRMAVELIKSGRVDTMLDGMVMAIEIKNSLTDDKPMTASSNYYTAVSIMNDILKMVDPSKNGRN